MRMLLAFSVACVPSSRLARRGCLRHVDKAADWAAPRGPASIRRTRRSGRRSAQSATTIVRRARLLSRLCGFPRFATSAALLLRKPLAARAMAWYDEYRVGVPAWRPEAHGPLAQ